MPCADNHRDMQKFAKQFADNSGMYKMGMQNRKFIPLHVSIQFNQLQKTKTAILRKILNSNVCFPVFQERTCFVEISQVPFKVFCIYIIQK